MNINQNSARCSLIWDVLNISLAWPKMNISSKMHKPNTFISSNLDVNAWETFVFSSSSFCFYFMHPSLSLYSNYLFKFMHRFMQLYLYKTQMCLCVYMSSLFCMHVYVHNTFSLYEFRPCYFIKSLKD